MTPLGKLLKDGISVAAAPTGGMGLALTDEGKIPDEALRVEFCEVSNSAAQSINDNTLTLLTFNTEQTDRFDLHSNSTNTSRITVKRPGVYFAEAFGAWASSPGANTELALLVSGAVVRRTQVLGDYRALHISAHLRLTADSYVEARVYQNSGAAVNFSEQGLLVHWVSPPAAT